MPSKHLDSTPYGLNRPSSNTSVGTDSSELDITSFKDVQLRKLGHHTKEFLWLGSSWSCRKRRKHYESFRRNGVKISVHDFVYVLAEEGKRLVAYLEDMYEDSRGNKMVMVRWFHKIDEVGIVLPHNFNDREIFFSLCLQDLSVECIDGLATVLNPQHFEKFLNEATCTQLEPFVCHRQFDNDDVKPFDITRVKGYWKQEILRFMHPSSPSSVHVKSQPANDGMKLEGNASNTSGIRPRKRYRPSTDDDVRLPYSGQKESVDAACMDLKNVGKASSSSPKETVKQMPPQYLAVGSQVEVLCQDSGIRGCWFRALIIKKSKDKVKVRYQDLQDADDEDKNLEEWLLASRIAAPDELGLRISGRKTIRPAPQSNRGKVSWVIDVGSIVDAWQHDGWWEGIVVQKDSEYKFHVFLPGEKKKSVLSYGDLRHSQEWVGNRWEHLRERLDLVNLILCRLETRQVGGESSNSKQAEAGDKRPLPTNAHKGKLLMKDEAVRSSSVSNNADDAGRKPAVPDLLKDELRLQLKWESTRKRRRSSGSSVEKQPRSSVKSREMKPEARRPRMCEGFMIPVLMKVDHENCKYIGDSPFSSSVVQPLTSLVMSR
ncbi:uncharacterized protein LOC131153984 isoform X2 [Malania oleifera]|uniref:uncharacterized protein LOC131153984 isoform X2 n=1 Tax=Malania oleifera TaxID=397392 RepID=UPI0025AE1009|nr:uncharacterized protein LOC131153984 isoform X2 [Malania oleifera]XP_057962414.1 uncharacterized protein LOC131153984 isoform X2 [Malania oleifera]